jgi:uncharacterized integral membrane protein
MKKFKGWLILFICLLFLIFVVQNTHVVTVRFLFWKAEASRVLVLIGTFMIGLIAGWLLASPGRKEQGTVKIDK